MEVGQLIAEKQNHYQIKFANTAKANEIVVSIFSEISDWWGYGLPQLAYDLHGKSDPVRILLNSPGGDLTQGIAIRSFLSNYPGTVTVEVLGLAASSATIVATGADTVEINTGALYMIHNPATMSGGTADQLSSDAANLKKIEGEMAALYLAGIQKRDKMNGNSADEMTAQILAWMAAETWFTAQEAVDYGFADAVIGTSEQAATAAITAQITTQYFAQYKNAPQRVLNIANTMATETKKPGLIAQLKAFLASAEAEEVTDTATEATEAAPEADPIQAAKDLLAAQGYTIDEPAEAAEATEEEPVVIASVKTYTQAEVQAQITAALKTAEATRKAGTAVTATANNSTTDDNAQTRREKLRAEAGQKMNALANAMKR